MKTVRIGVFETNSSSTHSMTITTKKEFQAWKNGEVLFDEYSGVFITLEEANKEILQSLNEDGKMFPEINRQETEDKVRKDLGFQTYKEYMEDDYLEDFSYSYTTPNGEEIIAFGKYGYNG
jgi:hypothetical protein